MALDEKFYSLYNVQFTLKSGVRVDATQVDVKITQEFKERRAGGSKVMQRVALWRDAEITVKGWNSDDFSIANIEPGTGVDQLAIDTELNSDSVLPDWFWTDFPPEGWAFGDTETSYGDDPSQWTTVIRPNTLNVPA